MRTLLLDCSPKRKLSASGFILDLMSPMIRGEKERLHLRSKADIPVLLEAFEEADAVVFSMPLYVDSVPSHVLPFLREAERLCGEKALRPRIYVIANNGFIEGKQNEPLMQVMENFCTASGLKFCGGLGIGGGVMMNVMRILMTVFLVLMAVNVIGGWAMTGAFHVQPILEFLLQLLVLGLLMGGILFYGIRLAACIGRGRTFGKHYTRILLPAVLFIPVTDLFFTVMSLAEGGIFRGWFAAKKPVEKKKRMQEAGE